MSTDAIVILGEDHRQIRRLFRTSEETGENADAARADIANDIVEAVTVLTNDVLQSFEEDHVAEVLCHELAAMHPGDERLRAKTTVLIHAVTRHLQDEEQDRLPKVRPPWDARNSRTSAPG